MPKITFLGSGGFFPPRNNFHSNLLLTSDYGYRMLIDCGTDIRHSIKKKYGCDLNEIDAIYVSHTHDDHAGGLEYLAFYYRYIAKYRPTLIAHESVMDILWQYKLMMSLRFSYEQSLTLKHYFKVKSVKRSFTWDDIKFSLVPGIHILNNEDGHMYSFGLFIDTGKTKVYFTSDLSYPEGNVKTEEWNLSEHWKNYEKADLILHECETTKQPSKVHVHYDFLKQFPTEIKEKMFLYHYSRKIRNVKRDGFAGFVKPGQTFNI